MNEAVTSTTFNRFFVISISLLNRTRVGGKLEIKFGRGIQTIVRCHARLMLGKDMPLLHTMMDGKLKQFLIIAGPSIIVYGLLVRIFVLSAFSFSSA